MSTVFSVDALGVRVAIDVQSGDPLMIARVRSAWRDAMSASDAATAERGTIASVVGSDAYALSRLSTDVTLAALNVQRGNLWMLHAAALALGDGRTIALVGPSGRGKTTASRLLGTRFGYVSDETTAITPDGMVLPYRKPLSIIETAGDEKVQRAPSDLGLRPPPSSPLRLARIVLLDRRPDGPAEPVVSDVALSDALVPLVEQTSYLADLPRPLATIAGHVDSTGGIVRVVYREASTLLAVFEELACTSPTTPLFPPGPERRWPVDEGEIRRAPTIDEMLLDDGDRLALLQGDNTAGGAALRILDGTGPTIWANAHTTDFAALVHAVIDRHGVPPAGDPEALVREAVGVLREEGVLLPD